MPNESQFFPDKIRIEQLDVFTRIGVPEEERANPQKLTVNISLWPYQQVSDMADHIERAVRAEIVIAYSQQNDLIEASTDIEALHKERDVRPTKVVAASRVIPRAKDLCARLLAFSCNAQEAPLMIVRFSEDSPTYLCVRA